KELHGLKFWSLNCRWVLGSHAGQLAELIVYVLRDNKLGSLSPGSKKNAESGKNCDPKAPGSIMAFGPHVASPLFHQGVSPTPAVSCGTGWRARCSVCNARDRPDRQLDGLVMRRVRA